MAKIIIIIIGKTTRNNWLIEMSRKWWPSQKRWKHANYLVLDWRESLFGFALFHHVVAIVSFFFAQTKKRTHFFLIMPIDFMYHRINELSSLFFQLPNVLILLFLEEYNRLHSTARERKKWCWWCLTSIENKETHFFDTQIPKISLLFCKSST